MKRIVRDVIKIVTTIRRLPEAGEHLTHSPDQVGLETAAGPPSTNSDNPSEPIADSTDHFSSYVCYTYIFVYHVLEH